MTHPILPYIICIGLIAIGAAFEKHWLGRFLILAGAVGAIGSLLWLTR